MIIKIQLRLVIYKPILEKLIIAVGYIYLDIKHFSAFSSVLVVGQFFG